MITVPEATRKIIQRSRYLSEAISKGIINYSSLARYIKPELEEMLMKKISNASIMMALNRLEPEFAPKYKQANIFKTTPDIIVRSGLSFLVLPNDDVAGLSLLLSREPRPKSVYMLNQGIHETSIVLSRDLYEKYKNAIENKAPQVNLDKVSTVAIYLPADAIVTSGIYYFFLKSLAWEGVNVINIVSTPGELTLVVADSDSARTFSIINSLFAS